MSSWSDAAALRRLRDIYREHLGASGPPAPADTPYADDGYYTAPNETFQTPPSDAASGGAPAQVYGDGGKVAKRIVSAFEKWSHGAADVSRPPPPPPPLTLYHGTRSPDFEEFKVSRDGDNPIPGVSLASRPSTADYYSLNRHSYSPTESPDVSGSRTMKVHARGNYRNYYEYRDDLRARLTDLYGKDNHYLPPDSIVSHAQRDGLSGFHFPETDEYRVFNPADIKSATGNRGTYDLADPRINYRKGGGVDDYGEGRMTPTPAERRTTRERRIADWEPGADIVTPELERLKRHRYSPLSYLTEGVSRLDSNLKNATSDLTALDYLNFAKSLVDQNTRAEHGTLGAVYDGLSIPFVGAGKALRIGAKGVGAGMAALGFGPDVGHAAGTGDYGWLTAPAKAYFNPRHDDAPGPDPTTDTAHLNKTYAHGGKVDDFDSQYQSQYFGDGGMVQRAGRAIKNLYGSLQHGRFEQAADLTPLDRYSEKGLMKLFDPAPGAQNGLLTAMPPADFQDFALRLPEAAAGVVPYPRWPNSPRGYRTPTDKRTQDEYLKRMMDNIGRFGLGEAPDLRLYKTLDGMTGVESHEGRHRIMALDRLGDKKSLVHLRPANSGELRHPLDERLEMMQEKYFPRGADTPIMPESGQFRGPTLLDSDAFAEGGPVKMQVGGFLRRLASNAAGKPKTIHVPGLGHVEAAPIKEFEDVASKFAAKNGNEYPIQRYPEYDADKAKRIAAAYEEMKHDPSNPQVARAYDALIEETMDQYRALKGTGVDFSFLKPGEADPYARTPTLGYLDLINNGRLKVFPTEQGFGTLNDIRDNPMLKKVGRVGDLDNATANDAFRIVHDSLGHFGPGNPFFRAKGEERAWNAHTRSYSPDALPAATTETRGQNSWVNSGPHAEANRLASGADTVYADQKVGLLPEWAWKDEPHNYAEGGGVEYHQSIGRVAPRSVEFVKNLDQLFGNTSARAAKRVRDFAENSGREGYAFGNDSMASPLTKGTQTGVILPPEALPFMDANARGNNPFFSVHSHVPITDQPISSNFLDATIQPRRAVDLMREEKVPGGLYPSYADIDALQSTHPTLNTEMIEAAGRPDTRMAIRDPFLKSREAKMFLMSRTAKGREASPESLRRMDELNKKLGMHPSDMSGYGMLVNDKLANLGLGVQIDQRATASGGMPFSDLLSEYKNYLTKHDAMPFAEGGGVEYHQSKGPVGELLAKGVKALISRDTSKIVPKKLPEESWTPLLSRAAEAAGTSEEEATRLIRAAPWMGTEKKSQAISAVVPRTPYSDASALYGPTPDLLPTNLLRPEDLAGSRIISQAGDRLLTNAELRGLNGTTFSAPVTTHGGPDYSRGTAGRAGSAWASDRGPISNYMNVAREAEAQGFSPIGTPLSMGRKSLDSTKEMTQTLLRMLENSSPSREGSRQFNDAMRTQLPTWPGLRSPGLEEWQLGLKTGERGTMPMTMDAASYRDAGFPDIASARLALTTPEALLNPSLSSGRVLSTIDPKTLPASLSHVKHPNYSTQLAGEYVGGFGRHVPVDVMFPQSLEARLRNIRPSRLHRSVMMSPLTEDVTPKWIDSVSSWLEKADREGIPKARGGPVDDFDSQYQSQFYDDGGPVAPDVVQYDDDSRGFFRGMNG